MGIQSRVRVPTLTSISSAEKTPSTARPLIKTLSRLSRPSLIRLALKWLEPENQPLCAPYLASNRDIEEETEEDYLYTPAENIEDLRKIYEGLKDQSDSKRDVIDRILDGDWRRGISLHQLAMVDFQHLGDNETSMRWSALRLVPLEGSGDDDYGSLKEKRRISAPAFPRLHSSTFMQALQREISPLVKAHYYLHHLTLNDAPLTVLRLYVADTPYDAPSATQSFFTDGARAIFIAFPDSCPYIYVALNGLGGSTNKHSGPTSDAAALKRTVLEAVPKALSKPQQRYALETTAMTARSLKTAYALRGNGKGGASGGAYTIFVDAKPDDSPLTVSQAPFAGKLLGLEENSHSGDVRPGDNAPQCDVSYGRKRKALADRDSNVQTIQDDRGMKKRRTEAARLFGATGLKDSEHKAPIDRLQIRLDEYFLCRGSEGRHSDLDASTAHREDNSSIPSATTSKLKRSSLLDRWNPHYTKDPSSLCTAHNTSTISAQSRSPVTLTFHGTDIFAGLRKLAEKGMLDMEKLPPWMTGEENVSNGLVRDGVMISGKGGGDN